MNPKLGADLDISAKVFDHYSFNLVVYFTIDSPDFNFSCKHFKFVGFKLVMNFFRFVLTLVFVFFMG